VTRDEIHGIVEGILVQLYELEPAAVQPTARLKEDLDLDSLDALDMLVELMTLTGRRVSEEEMRSLKTVGDVVGLVERTQHEAALRAG
jgi:acyl carrier protein